MFPGFHRFSTEKIESSSIAVLVWWVVVVLVFKGVE
jgi:hypothetical protein